MRFEGVQGCGAAKARNVSGKGKRPEITQGLQRVTRIEEVVVKETWMFRQVLLNRTV
jgi:hypothetical protein